MKDILRNLSILLGCLMLSNLACTDLSEQPYRDVTSENFFQSEEEFISAMGQAYTSLGFLGSHASLWSSNEVASDQLVVTVKGGDWYSGGQLQSLHSHTFTPDNGYFYNVWTSIYEGISNCNQIIFQLQSFVEAGNVGAEAYVAEMRVLRALYFYWALDAFGNVPLYIDFTDENPPSNATDFQTGRTAIYDFVETELNATISMLDPTVGGKAYGRMNQASAFALRSKLYLNSYVFTGGERQEYVKAIADADTIAAFGFSLTGSYRDNFTINNEGSPENIFVIPYDKVFSPGFNWSAMTLHYESRGTFNFTFQPWNGYAVVEEFYNSYLDPAQNPGPQGAVWTGLAPFDPENDRTPNNVGTLDARLSNFLVGPQFNADGTPTYDPAFETETYAQPDPDGPRLNFTPQNNELFPNGWRQGGARIGKYEYEIGGTPDASNDFVVFRFADILLTKAEALWRTGDEAGALVIINQIRSRAGVDPLTDLDGPPSFNPTGEDIPGGEILNERGREMFAEMTRRQDLIRFDQWGELWWEKTGTDDKYKVFPIPRVALDVSTVLYQNPGY
jgi:hypothetical protein